jgi:hypothetical protein
MKGVQVEELITFNGTPTADKGVLHGVGKGVIMVVGGEGDPEMVSYTGEGIGRVSSTGNVKWCGSVFFRKSSGDKLAFLNNTVRVFESEIDIEGNFSEKVWEWR